MHATIRLCLLLVLVPAHADDLRAAATAGDPWAQLNLGAAYDHGLNGLEPDPIEAVRWYRRAAEAGIAEARFNLAHCLATGHGVARDDAEAAVWMARAARQGLADAQFLLGVMLLEGVGLTADPVQARSWLGRAAGQGQQDARALLQQIDATDSDR